MTGPQDDHKKTEQSQSPLTPMEVNERGRPDDSSSALNDMLNAFGFRSRLKKSKKNKTTSSTETLQDEKKKDKKQPYTTAAQDIVEDKDDIPARISDVLKKTTVQRTNLHDENKMDLSISLGLVAATKKRKINKKGILLIISPMIIVALWLYLSPILLEPWPPGENIVASYNDKMITEEDLQNFIKVEGIREREHTICEVHGFDHSQCDQYEECEQHPIDSVDGYRQMTNMLVMEEIIQTWADEKGISQREEVQHGLSDLLNDANVSQFIAQVHENEITPESIPKWEIQQYYDENREKYDGRSFNEVEAEIRQILIQQKDEEYFPAYIEELKKTAGLEVNFDLLKITEPTQDEITAYMQTNIKDYQSEASANIEEIRITTSDKAKEAYKQLGAGESFENVAASFSDTGKADEITVVKGSRDVSFEEAVWKLQPNEISKTLTNSDGSSSIVRLIRLNDAGTRSLADSADEIKTILLLENMDREYSINKTEALFSIDGKRYTLGNFYTEFMELSPEYQQMFATFEAKKQLLEQYITKELLLEESTDTSMSDQKQHDMEDLRIQYFSQILHQEEIDGQIDEPTDKDVEQFYNGNLDKMTTLPSVKISLIWLSQGLQGETKDQAMQRAQEAMSAIQGGTDFGEVAKTFSEDNTKMNGGFIDEWLYEENMPEKVGEAIFALSPGGVTDIIDSMGGYYIIQLNEKKDAQRTTLEESSDAIRTYLKNERHAELEKEMEGTLLDKSNLVIYDRTLRRMLEQQGSAAK